MQLADQVLFGSREIDRIITDIRDMIGIIMSSLMREDRMVNPLSDGAPTRNPPFDFEGISEIFDFGTYRWSVSANRDGGKLVWLRWRIKCSIINPDGTEVRVVIDSCREDGGIDRHLFPKEYALGTHDTLRSLFPELAKRFPFLHDRWSPMVRVARIFENQRGQPVGMVWRD